MPFWRLNIPFAMSKDNIRYVKTHLFCFFNKYKTATLLWFQFLTINFVLPVKTVRTTITSKLFWLNSGFEGLKGCWKKRTCRPRILDRDRFEPLLTTAITIKVRWRTGLKSITTEHFSIQVILVTRIVIVCMNCLNRWLKCSLKRWIHGCQFCRCDSCCLRSSSHHWGCRSC